MKWKKIPLETTVEYWISDTGLIYSTFTNKLMSSKIDRSGYSAISLRKKDGPSTINIHRLVALTFLPPSDNTRTFINHIDGIKTNNNVTNLEWCTRSENSQHAKKMGLLANRKGSSNLNSKLNDDIVRNIRKDYADGTTFDQIASKYNISRGHSFKIVKGVHWGHVV